MHFKTALRRSAGSADEGIWCLDVCCRASLDWDAIADHHGVMALDGEFHAGGAMLRRLWIASGGSASVDRLQPEW